MFLSYYTPLQFYRAHVQRVCELCFHVAVNHKFEGNTTIFYPPTNWNTLVVMLGKRAESSPPSYYDTHVLTHSWHLANLLWIKSEPIQPCMVLKPQKTWKCQSSWMQNLWIRYKEKTVFQSSYTLVGIDPIWIFAPNLANHVICFD